MKILLLAGLGPSWPEGSAFYDSAMLNETFLDKTVYHLGLKRMLDTKDFVINLGDKEIPLFRKRNSTEKNLTMLTLESLLSKCGVEYESVDLEKLWNNDDFNTQISPDMVFLSTTFICNFHDLDYAIKGIRKRYPDAAIVVGGQFSNLKYRKIMELYPEVKYILLGDGEISIPAFVNSGEKNLSTVPNLVWKDNGNIVKNDIELCDLDSVSAPQVNGATNVMYYESMRGCAFSCKFCSFPAASPKWRFKSATKIANDWIYYNEKFGIKRMRAMDSAFTFPEKRLNELISILKDKNIEWEAYSRADVIDSPEKIKYLEEANCRLLSIGFESMSDATLLKMNKRITSAQNRKANELLNENATELDFRGSFIVGFPGETVEDYQKTHDFLVNEYKKQFHLSVFSLVDETMPIWNEADKYNLVVTDMNNPDYNWSHSGMDAKTARHLHEQTLFDVRWYNEHAVAVEWQLPYEMPFNPSLNFTQNYRIEKLIERLAFIENDFPDNLEFVEAKSQEIVEELKTLGISIKEPVITKTDDVKRLKKINS